MGLKYHYFVIANYLQKSKTNKFKVGFACLTNQKQHHYQSFGSITIPSKQYPTGKIDQTGGRRLRVDVQDTPPIVNGDDL
jgi:hypothetical protein